MNKERNLPLSLVTMIFGILSIPLAFARHLVSLALVLALLSIAFGLFSRLRARKRSYATSSLNRSRIGFLFGVIGAACSLVMWWLWASNILLE
jgi:lysylphosphatidylglycerol synthetase-like protein (DUF2156 family)